jgi:hypothetical protein
MIKPQYIGVVASLTTAHSGRAPNISGPNLAANRFLLVRRVRKEHVRKLAWLTDVFSVFPVAE